MGEHSSHWSSASSPPSHPQVKTITSLCLFCPHSPALKGLKVTSSKLNATSSKLNAMTRRQSETQAANIWVLIPREVQVTFMSSMISYTAEKCQASTHPVRDFQPPCSPKRIPWESQERAFLCPISASAGVPGHCRSSTWERHPLVTPGHKCGDFTQLDS